MEPDNDTPRHEAEGDFGDGTEPADSDSSRRSFLKKLVYVPPAIQTVHLLSATAWAQPSPVGPPPPGPITITDCSPDSASPGETLNVTITGSNFETGTTVDFGGGSKVDVNSVTYTNSTQLYVSITVQSNASFGFRDIEVKNTGNDKATLTNGFEVVLGTPPTVISCVPNTGSKNSTIFVAVSGTDFVDTPDADFGGGIQIRGVTFNSSTSLTVEIRIRNNASTGTRDVTITNPDTQSDTLFSGFTVTN